MNDISKIKKMWFKSNLWKILLTSMVVVTLFVFYMLSQNIIFDILAIILGFVAIIYFRNKLIVFIEDNTNKE